MPLKALTEECRESFFCFFFALTGVRRVVFKELTVFKQSQAESAGAEILKAKRQT